MLTAGSMISCLNTSFEGFTKTSSYEVEEEVFFFVSYFDTSLGFDWITLFSFVKGALLAGYLIVYILGTDLIYYSYFVDLKWVFTLATATSWIGLLYLGLLDLLL